MSALKSSVAAVQEEAESWFSSLDDQHRTSDEGQRRRRPPHAAPGLGPSLGAAAVDRPGSETRPSGRSLGSAAHGPSAAAHHQHHWEDSTPRAVGTAGVGLRSWDVREREREPHAGSTSRPGRWDERGVREGGQQRRSGSGEVGGRYGSWQGRDEDSPVRDALPPGSRRYDVTISPTRPTQREVRDGQPGASAAAAAAAGEAAAAAAQQQHQAVSYVALVSPAAGGASAPGSPPHPQPHVHSQQQPVVTVPTTLHPPPGAAPAPAYYHAVPLYGMALAPPAQGVTMAQAPMQQHQQQPAMPAPSVYQMPPPSLQPGSRPYGVSLYPGVGGPGIPLSPVMSDTASTASSNLQERLQKLLGQGKFI